MADQEHSLLWSVPWAHHVILIENVEEPSVRRWYMEQTLANGWSRNVLALQIGTRAHARGGKAASNFKAILPPPQSDLAQQTLKDPHIFDFLTLDQPFHERELETQLVRHLEKFLLASPQAS
jgi:predicted nuclease of restriction endonuclease-like (RecB) superfamily